MNSAADKLTFFRQGAWMVLATVAGGVFMTAVHMVASSMDSAEYGVFQALLRIFLLMGFPAGGLQTVFAQQAAAAISQKEERQLSQTTRSVLFSTFVIWLFMAGVIYFKQDSLISTLKISNPAALWLTVALGLAQLWFPIFRGILQGTQHFLALGWVLILDGIGRFTAIALIIHFHGQAAGGMAGALIGQALSACLAIGLTYRIWSGPGASFEWRPWLKTVVPLTLGVGTILFMNSADVIFVQSLFAKDQTPYYAAAAMIGLALVMFTTPLTAVMFPKIVQSAARTERSNALEQALGATALLGGLAALACWILPKLPLQIIYFRTPDFWKSYPLVPWFATSLLPLILANVLITNLLARRKFAAVPWLVAVVVGYTWRLWVIKPSLSKLELFEAYKTIIQTMGLFNLVLLVTAFVFTRLARPENQSGKVANA